MRNIFKIKTLALALAAATGTSHAALSYYVETGATFTPDFHQKAGNGLSSFIYLSGSHKLDDNWSTGFEIYETQTWVDKGVFDFDYSHGYIRIPLTRRNINIISGWKTSMLFRWEVPTTARHQTAGGFGDILFRPTFSTESGAFSLTLRPQVKVSLVDRGYQKFTLPGEAVKGNTLGTWALDFFPGFKLNDAMSITLLGNIRQSYTGGAPGKSGAFNPIALDYDLRITNPYKLAGFDSWLDIGYGTKFTKADFKIIDVKALRYTVAFARSF